MTVPAPEKVVIGNAELWLGDCRDVLPMLAPVSAVVTDPPYGLSFMGKRWDYDVPPTDLWALVLDRLLPGGHLLAFAGTRTQHRMAVRIEDAGFEIRDMLAWVYGSGFPKSLDVGKAIDKAAGAERRIIAEGAPVKRMIPGADQHATGSWIKDNGRVFVPTTTEPATEAARQWNGWGTALKPAFEPITLARKPLVGTVAANVMEHGAGALNIDGCRAGDFQNTTPSGVDRRNAALAEAGYRPGAYQMGEKTPSTPPGRWPANLIHDGSDEVVALFPETGISKGGYRGRGVRDGWGMAADEEKTPIGFGDSGSAARFFYCAKASKADREGSTHPTMKPTDLMRYLCRLVTPPGGVVLDPFMGSGSTGKAAMLEGFRFVGIERDRRYFDIACERIARAQAQGTLLLPEEPRQLAQAALL